MGAIDLNADLGETVGGVPTADDEAMFALISSANIACGGHAGDAVSMRESAERAARFGVAVGAHPSYVDPEGFGRVARFVSPARLDADISAQLDALAEAGADIRYVKPHGALYHAVSDDPVQAAVLSSAVARFAARLGRDVAVVGLPGPIQQAAAARELRFVREAFLDRGYRADGTLVPRGEAGALLDDPAAVAARAVRLALDGVVHTVDGSVIGVDAASLCLHGDSPAAIAMARAVHAALDAEGIEVRAPW